MDSLTQIKTLVSRGSICTILAPASVEENRRRGELVSAPIVSPVIRRPVYLVRNPTGKTTRAGREVESLVVRVVGELVNDGTWQADLVIATSGEIPLG